MSNSWALDENWDMYLDGDEIARVAGSEELAQYIKERLQFFFEEWFLDRDAGVPWYQLIFKKGTKPAVIEARIKQEIIETPGVNELLEFDINFDFQNRLIKVLSFTVDTDQGILTETL